MQREIGRDHGKSQLGNGVAGLDGGREPIPQIMRPLEFARGGSKNILVEEALLGECAAKAHGVLAGRVGGCGPRGGRQNCKPERGEKAL